MPNYNPNDYDPSKAAFEAKSGKYDFVVMSANEQTSKSSNEMIALELQVNIGDREIKVYDYLVFHPKCTNKIHDFCDVTGLPFDGSLTAVQCDGCKGRANFVLGEAKANGNRYLEVGYYLTNKFAESPAEMPNADTATDEQVAAHAAVHKAVTNGDYPDDDIPF